MLRKTLYALIGLMIVTAIPAAAGKVGFVDVQKAAATVQQGKVAIREFEQWAAPRRKRLDSLKAAGVRAAQQLAKEQGVASDAVLEKLQNRAVNAKRTFEDAAREFNRQAGAKRDQLLNAVATRMRTIIDEYAKSHGYDAVLVFKPMTIIYLSKSSDLTDTVIKLYDARFPAVQPTTSTLPGLQERKRK